MQQRPSSRLLVLDADRAVLLFRFEHKRGPLSGQAFWATPGGAVDDGETYEDAARRELYEEVGIEMTDVGPQIARRVVTFGMPDGSTVEADERYFLVHAGERALSDANWTALEREVMAAHRWWSQEELATTADQVWPENLADMLIEAGAWPPG